MSKPWNWKFILAGWIFFTLLTILVMHNAFFWDTVQLGSKHAHWFYDHNFSQLTLPNEIDSGHPPVFGMYLAAVWKIFGRSLSVSHFAMLPFLFGIVLQVYLLIRKFSAGKMTGWGMLLLLMEPTLLAQSSLVSPDLVLVFFYLLSLNAMLSGKRTLLTLSLMGLGIISLRGIMSVVAIFFCDLVFNLKGNKKKFFKIILNYLPAAILTGTWLLWHYQATGWIGFHKNSPWADSFQSEEFSGIIRNLGLICWRFLDFGRVFLWLAGLILIYLFWIKKRDEGKNLFKIFLLFAIPLLCYLPSMATHRELAGHRYFLVPFLLGALFIFFLWQQLESGALKSAMGIIVLLGLLTGHLWRYPEGTAMGWDATLGHLPYYKMRTEMLQYIKENKMVVDSIGSAFPNLASFREIDLSDDTSHFAPKDLNHQSFILYSNIYNGFTDDEIDSLQKNWSPLKELNCFPVRMILYQKKLPFIYFQF